MKLIAIGHWSNTAVGSYADGDLFDCPDDMAKTFIERGLARLAHETKPAQVKQAPNTKPHQPAKPLRKTKK